MMMNKLEFKKYPSIDRIDRKKTIDYIVQMGLDKDKWQVSLKVHGANFGIYYNGLDMESSKRSGFIVNSDGGFHNYQNVIANYQKNIYALYHYLNMTGLSFKNMILYGELFGGQYDHPDVEKDPHASRVQKGVQYCPHNDFFLFDIVVDGMFLPKSYVHKAIYCFGFVGALPLFTGTFIECLEHSNEFPDPLHETFDLPRLEGSAYEENVCEGVVVEPAVPKFFPSGSRVILKNKNDKFSEKASHKRMNKVQKPHEWTEEGKIAVDEVLQYITENRLRNVLSHIGEITQKDFGKVMGLFAQDVYKSYLTDCSDHFNTLDNKEQDMVKKEMQRECANCIRPNFRNILDGEY